MKLLVISDSHGKQDCLQHLKELYQNKVDKMIHCGDSELQKDDPALSGFETVRGNCDFDLNLPNELVLETGGYRIFVTHGHLYNIKMTMMNLRYRARELNARFAFFGHSHQLGADILDNTIIVNPGSITSPRGPIRKKTYSLIEKISEEKIKICFMDNNDQEITELTQIFPFY